MKSTPAGWPRISSALYYDDAAAAIDWICNVFGFEIRLKIEGDQGEIVHSELTFGDGLVMVSDARLRSAEPYPLPSKSPQSIGGTNTQSLCIYVDDADAHYEHARAAGAQIIDQPATHDYGEDF